MKNILLYLSLVTNGAVFMYANHIEYRFNTVPQIKNNESLHQWASQTISNELPDDKDGNYNICYARNVIREDGGKYSEDLQNACAIVEWGAEW